MNIFFLSRYTFGFVAAVAVLAGCATGGQSVPASNGAPAPSDLPSANSKTDAYVYASDYGSSTLYMYGYDDRSGTFGKQLGSTTQGISGPQGLCAGNGKVWLANKNDTNLLSYKAGSLKSTGTLSITNGYPTGCAVDSKGDIAVSNFCNATGCGPGNVDIFKEGKGTPTPVTCPNLNRYYFIAYDTHDNIWVDGESSNYVFAMCEILAGKTTGNAVTLKSPPGFPGGVQWYGKYLTVVDQNASTLGMYKVQHLSGKLDKIVTFLNANHPVETAIFGKFILIPNGGEASLGSYKFPAGGSPVDTVIGFDQPAGIVVTKPLREARPRTATARSHRAH